MIKDLGPLTQSANGKIRGAAKQLSHAAYDAVAQSAMEMPETAGARQLMLQARAAYRQEAAVNSLREILTPGGSVLRYENGQLVLKPNALMNQFSKKLMSDDPLFRGSFSPDRLAQLQADIRGFAQTPGMPTGEVPLPGAVGVRQVPQPTPPDVAPLPGAMSVKGLEVPTYTPPELVQPKTIRPYTEPTPPELVLPESIKREPSPIGRYVPSLPVTGLGVAGALT